MTQCPEVNIKEWSIGMSPQKRGDHLRVKESPMHFSKSRDNDMIRLTSISLSHIGPMLWLFWRAIEAERVPCNQTWLFHPSAKLNYVLNWGSTSGGHCQVFNLRPVWKILSKYQSDERQYPSCPSQHPGLLVRVTSPDYLGSGAS